MRGLLLKYEFDTHTHTHIHTNIDAGACPLLSSTTFILEVAPPLYSLLSKKVSSLSLSLTFPPFLSSPLLSSLSSLPLGACGQRSHFNPEREEVAW